MADNINKEIESNKIYTIEDVKSDLREALDDYVKSDNTDNFDMTVFAGKYVGQLYMPLLVKNAIIRDIINSSLQAYADEGLRYSKDALGIEFKLITALLNFYTNIKFDISNEEESIIVFDVLSSTGVLDGIINNISDWYKIVSYFYETYNSEIENYNKKYDMAVDPVNDIKIYFVEALNSITDILKANYDKLIDSKVDEVARLSDELSGEKQEQLFNSFMKIADYLEKKKE